MEGDLVVTPVGTYLQIGIVKRVDTFTIASNQSDSTLITYPNWSANKWISIYRLPRLIIPIEPPLLIKFQFPLEKTRELQRRMLINKFEEMNGPTNWFTT